MLRFLLYIFLIYLVYQFVFNFLVPVYRTTQKLRNGFREMNNNMNGPNQHQENSTTQKTQPQNSSSKEQVGDYIDFEEIK